MIYLGEWSRQWEGTGLRGRTTNRAYAIIRQLKDNRIYEGISLEARPPNY